MSDTVTLTLEEKLEIAIQALRFYGHPDTYFATAIWPDPPAGEINADWGLHGFEEYEDDDQRVGALARTALELLGENYRDIDYQFLNALRANPEAQEATEG